MNSKIKKYFENSQYYINYKNIDHVVHKFENIKNDYLFSKKKYKKDLFLFIHEFIKHDVKNEFLEEYVLYLSEKYGFDSFNKEIYKLEESVLVKLYEIDSIKLLLDEKITDNEFIYKNCTPSYFLKHDINPSKISKNKKMDTLISNLNSYRKILNKKIKIGSSIKKYVKYTEDINEDFIKAIKVGNMKNIIILIKNGANIHYENENALIDSIRYNRLDIVKVLIENGSDIHIDNDYPFFLSISHGCLNISKFLIEKGSNIHSENDRAFRHSANMGCFRRIKFLIEHGCDLHIDNDIAFINLVFQCDINNIKYLIEKGANIHAENDKAIQIYSYFGKINLLKYLINTDLEYFSRNKFAREVVIKHNLVEFYEKFNIE